MSCSRYPTYDSHADWQMGSVPASWSPSNSGACHDHFVLVHIPHRLKGFRDGFYQNNIYLTKDMFPDFNIRVLNLGDGTTCDPRQRQCEFVRFVECVPEGAYQCSDDFTWIVGMGTGNAGSWNFGDFNVGDSNIGETCCSAGDCACHENHFSDPCPRDAHRQPQHRVE